MTALRNRLDPAFLTVFAVLLLAPTASASAAPVPGSATYAYRGPATYAGHVEAACDAWAVDVYKNHAGSLRIGADGGALLVQDTWVNVTVIDQTTLADDVNQTSRSVPVGPGFVELDWPSSGLATVWPYHYLRSAAARFQVHLEATRMDVAANSPAPPVPDSFYVRKDTGELMRADNAFPGWSRPVTSDHPAYVQGDVSIYLREASIQGPGGLQAKLDTYRENTSFSAASISKETVHFTDAFLDLHDARFSYAGDQGAAVCTRLAGKVEGNATFYDATGTAEAGGRNASFQGKVFGFSGAAMFDERPRSGPVGDRGSPYVDGHAEGAFQTLSIDRVPALPTDSGVPTIAKVGVWALVAAALVWLVKAWGSIVGTLYARFGPERVLHHEKRRLALQAIEQVPGSNVRELSSRLRLDYSTLRYHLKVLSRTGMIRTTSDGNAVRAWPAAITQDAAAAFRHRQVERDPQLAFVLTLLEPGPRYVPDLLDALVERFGLTRRGARFTIERGLRLRFLAADDGRESRGRWVRRA